ncbi:hypothetical protein [Anaeromyxobacter terrae]|uniref:hypothetical protein n=1 Tax=Anaeromyxobacter terrae TaxID=2925406 RepID=UPI001F586E23|nr:hypothetical protein [Anaeromyxobacter sp. SG22]
MTARARAATALLLLLAGGCGFSRGAVLARRVEPGPPLEDPGSEAYRLWHDGAGWHLRARADLPRRFHGEIAGASGRVTPQGVAPDAVSAGGGRIRFSFLAGDDAGFDFGGSCVNLALYIDGDPRPLRVFIGAFGAAPGRVPYRVCP